MHYGFGETPNWKSGGDIINSDSFLSPDNAGNKSQIQGYLDAASGRGTPYASSATLGPMTSFEGVKAAPTALDTAQDAQSRAYQMQLLQRLNQQAQGLGPSLAGQQLTQGYDQQMSQAAALAGSMRGRGNPNLAMRGLGMQQSQAGATLNQQMANARIAEIMGANSQMGAVASGMRGQDQSTAALQAQLAQQTALFNAGNQQQAGLFNAGTANDFTKTAAGYQQQTSLANQMAELQSRGLNDAQIRGMMAQKLGISESELAARMAYEQMHANAKFSQGTQNLAYGQSKFNQQMEQDKMALGMVSGIGGAMATASDERVKENVKPGAGDIHALLDAYGSRGMSHSPAGSKENIQPGGDRIHAFLASLGQQQPYVAPHAAPQMQMAGEDAGGMWAKLGRGAAAAKGKDAKPETTASPADLQALAGGSKSDAFTDAKGNSLIGAVRREHARPDAAGAAHAINTDQTPPPGMQYFHAASPEVRARAERAYFAQQAAAAADAQAKAKANAAAFYNHTDVTDPGFDAPAKPQNLQQAMNQTNGLGGGGNGGGVMLPAYTPSVISPQPAASPNAEMAYLNSIQIPTAAAPGTSVVSQPPVQDIAPQYFAASDERAKTGIEPGGHELHEFLGALGAHSYNYKEPGKPGRGEGTWISPMAQEVESTKLGAPLVTDTPDGKMVGWGTGKGMGLAFAALADIHKRTTALEKRKAG